MTVVIDPIDYEVVLSELDAEGEVSEETRQRLAAKVFRQTAAYDAVIAEYLTNAVGEQSPESLTVTYKKKNKAYAMARTLTSKLRFTKSRSPKEAQLPALIKYTEKNFPTII